MKQDFFALAVGLAKRYRERMHDPQAAPSVVVLRPLRGGLIGNAETEHSFSGCCAEEFEAGTLSIVDVRDGRILEEFGPGRWNRATVYGLDGEVDYSFSADGSRIGR